MSAIAIVKRVEILIMGHYLEKCAELFRPQVKNKCFMARSFGLKAFFKGIFTIKKLIKVKKRCIFRVYILNLVLGKVSGLL